MLQAIAMLTMLFDHIGIKCDIQVLRYIGRLSMPIYAYFIVKAVLSSKDIQKYKKRLLLIAVCSQLPFMGLLYGKQRLYFNVCFTWYLCTVFLDKLVHDKSDNIRISNWVAFLVLALAPVDYGLLALMWCLLWYCYMSKKYLGAVAFTLPILCYSINMIDYMQIISLCAVPLVILCEKYNKLWLKREYKYIWRCFYPAHLAVISCLH